MSQMGSADQVERTTEFYFSDIVGWALGSSWHPGGLAATRELGQALALPEGTRVLDLACGNGASARHLAETYGWRVVGMDAGAPGARRRGMDLIGGRMEAPPFRNGSFDGAYSECSLCLSGSIGLAAHEARRVLVDGGRFAVADITLEDPGELPPSLRTALAAVLCVASAGPRSHLMRVIGRAGFDVVEMRDWTTHVNDLLESWMPKAAMASRLVDRGEVTLGGVDVADAAIILDQCAGQVRRGNLGYWLIVGETPSDHSPSP